MVIVSDQISMVLSNRRPFSMCQCQYHSAKFVHKDPFIDAHSCISFCPSLIPRLLAGESLGMRLLLSLSLSTSQTQCHSTESVLPPSPPTLSSPHNSTLHTATKKPHTPPSLPLPPTYSPSQMQHQFAGAKLLSLPQRTPSVELQCTCASPQED